MWRRRAAPLLLSSREAAWKLTRKYECVKSYINAELTCRVMDYPAWGILPRLRTHDTPGPP